MNSDGAGLDRTERRIFGLIVKGCSETDIGEELHIPVSEVKAIEANIARKLSSKVQR